MHHLKPTLVLALARNKKYEIHKFWSKKDKSIKYLEWHSKYDATNNKRMKWHKLHDLGMHTHRIPTVCLFLIFRELARFQNVPFISHVPFTNQFG